MNNSKKRVLMITAIAVLLAVGAIASGIVKLPTAEMKSEKVAVEADKVAGAETVTDEKKSGSVLHKSRIVFFTQDGCGYCKMAKDYIDAKFPALAVEVVNIGTAEGFRRIKEVARQKRLRQVATPLILLGEDEYILGWGKSSEEKFNKFVEAMNK